MRLNVKAAAITTGFFWGVLAMFLIGMANLATQAKGDDAYGRAFLEAMASVYPGYKATPSFGQVVVAMLYGIVDGAIAGGLFAWIYNRIASCCNKAGA